MEMQVPDPAARRPSPSPQLRSSELFPDRDLYRRLALVHAAAPKQPGARCLSGAAGPSG